MQYTLSPLAQQDLQNIWQYSFKTWGETQATQYIRQIEGTCALLSHQPRLGTSIENIRTGYFKFFVNEHILFYRMANKSTLEIIRILHKHMDTDAHL